MEEREKSFLRQLYKVSQKNTMNLQEQCLYFLVITAVFVVSSFAYGLYQTLNKDYYSSVIGFLAAVFGYVLLRRIIKNMRSLTKETYALKKEFIDTYPQLQDEELKEIHKKINPLDTIGRARKET